MLPRLFANLGCHLTVDLGTANTLIGIPGEGIVLDEPSVVAVHQETGRILADGAAVGHLARQMLGRTPDGISVIRPLSAGVITDFQLCEAMLRHFMRKVARPGLRFKPRALVTVPGCITPVERQAVLNSTHRAGARQVFLLEESKAAAIGVGLPVAEPVASMVCDIGGGTTEVAVMSLGDIVASHSIRTGGDALDAAVVEYLRRQYSLRVGLTAAERLRIAIGSAFPLDRETADEVSGVDTVSGLPRKATVTSEEVREALAEPLEAILEAIHATLDQVPPELAADLVENGLLLCGGGALTARIDRFFSDRTGLPSRVAPEPRRAVASGALVCLEHFDKWRPLLQSGEEEV